MDFNIKATLPEILTSPTALSDLLVARTSRMRSQILNAFAKFMRRRIVEHIEKLKDGGTYRGVDWAPFKPYYTRADGTEVPAWGGIPKVRGKGNVKGRLRHSGKRMTSGSKLLQDTGHLKNEVAAHYEVSDNLSSVRISSGGTIPYEGYQGALRPFMFISNEDFTEFRSQVLSKYKAFR